MNESDIFDRLKTIFLQHVARDEVGKRADLLLLDANPLVSVANAQRRAGVMVNGRWLPESEIQRGLAAIAAGYAAP